jgi:hypothetical protein
MCNANRLRSTIVTFTHPTHRIASDVFGIGVIAAPNPSHQALQWNAAIALKI